MSKNGNTTRDQLTPEERKQAIERAAQGIEEIVAESGIEALATMAPLQQTIMLAKGINGMRQILTDGVVREYFMPLQGSPLGFVTDKDRDGGYPLEVVREVVIEGLLRGFRPVGNELNVIAGRFYGAKAGFQRIVYEFPGVTDLQYDLSVPHNVADKGALVGFYARWYFHGELQEMHGVPAGDGNPIDTRIAVKVNSGMGPDAILGKATRKLFARIYQRLTGCSRDVVEMDPDDYVDAKASGPSRVTAAPQGRRMSLKSAPAAEEPTESAAQLPANEPPPDPDNDGR